MVAALKTAEVTATKFLDGLFQKKNNAMAEAKGFGTNAYSAGTADWPAGTPAVAPGNNNNLLLIAAAAGALWYFSDEK